MASLFVPAIAFSLPRITNPRCVALRRLNIISRHMAMASLAPSETKIAGAKQQWHKTRVLILGSGWSGYVLSRNLDPKKHHITIVSPRSYFVFTPLLNDATVGTLEFPHVIEPVRSKGSTVELIQGWARSVDFKKRFVRVEGSVTEGGVTQADALAGDAEHTDDGNGAETRQQKHKREEEKEEKMMEVPYDKLVIAVGCNPQTFDTPGVKENALFLKDIGDAKRIRRRILECFELAAAPNCPQERRNHLLHFAVVGGGPTGMEFAGVLADLIHEDLMKVYPGLKGQAHVTLYDVAPKILGMFDDALAQYAREHMIKQGVDVKTQHNIQELRWGAPGQPALEKPDPKQSLTIKTKEQGEEGVGMCVWVTGNAMNPLIEKSLNGIDFLREEDVLLNGEKEKPQSASSIEEKFQIKKHEKTGALLIDDWLRVQVKTKDGNTTGVLRNVFGMGDGTMIESGAPPPTGETADQESKWLAKRFNAGDIETAKPFEFSEKGLIAYVGDSTGVVQKNGGSESSPNSITGQAAYYLWRGSYWNSSISWRNRMLIAYQWMITYFFGRDISRF